MKKRLALVGCGTLGKAAVRESLRLMDSDYELVAVHDISRSAMEELTADCGGKVCDVFPDLLAAKPDILIEAAGGAVL